MPRLAHGIYDQLVTEALRRVCDDPGLDIERSPLDPDVADEALARHVFQLLRAVLADQTGRGEEKLSKQLTLVNQIIGLLAQTSASTNDDDRVTPERLLQVLDAQRRSLGSDRLRPPPNGGFSVHLIGSTIHCFTLRARGRGWPAHAQDCSSALHLCDFHCGQSFCCRLGSPQHVPAAKQIRLGSAGSQTQRVRLEMPSRGVT